MKAAQGNDRLMVLNFPSPMAISVPETGNPAISAPGMRQPGGPASVSKRPAALMDTEKPKQSAQAKKRAAKKAAKKPKDRAARSGGGGGGGCRHPMPKAIMDRQLGGGKVGGKERDRTAGPVFPDGVLRQTSDDKTVCASCNKGTCTFARCKLAHVCWKGEQAAHAGKDHPQ